MLHSSTTGDNNAMHRHAAAEAADTAWRQDMDVFDNPTADDDDDDDEQNEDMESGQTFEECVRSEATAGPCRSAMRMPF